jgi:hypothetical protein
MYDIHIYDNIHKSNDIYIYYHNPFWEILLTKMPKKLPILLVYLLEPGRSVGSHILQTEAEIEWFADQA